MKAGMIGFGVSANSPSSFQKSFRIQTISFLKKICNFFVFPASKVWMFPVLDIGFLLVNHL